MPSFTCAQTNRQSVFFCLLCVACAHPLTLHHRVFGQQVDFESDIAPIFSQHCVRCHYDGNAQGDISLARIESIHEAGYLDSEHPEDSYLIELVEGTDGDLPEMPKDSEPLTVEQVDLIKRWVAQGAVWPKDYVVREKTEVDSSWWSFQPIRRRFKHASVDGFIADRLKADGLQMSKPANPRTLVRRATYDLTGLPPTPEEVATFLEDCDDSSLDSAYQKLLDRLLHSPHYGERWGRHWLDVVRFGESNGFERNVINNHIWPFRDYVIRSINQDKPFNQFIAEHLAGDVGRNDPASAIGTAFLVAGPYDDVGNQDAVQARQIRANTLDEIIRATSEAFLGLTIGCARCHDHKFDPILQSDYYSLYATFAGIRHGSVPLGTEQEKMERADRLRPLNEQRVEIERRINQMNASVTERAKHHLSRYQSRWTREPVDRGGTEETFDSRLAKFVRFVCEAQDTNLRSRRGFGIDEFEVWSASDSGLPSENLALATNGGKATGASRKIEDFPDAYTAELAIDGKTGGARFLAASDSLTIELAEPSRIDRVFFSSSRNAADVAAGGFFSFVAEYRIEVSLDGENWEEVANGRDRKPTRFASNPTHEEHRILELEMVEFERQQLKRLNAQLANIKREIAKVPELEKVWIGTRNRQDAAGPFPIFLGGSPEKHGMEVQPSSLSVLSDQSGYRLEVSVDESQRRRALADWLVGDDNPLTARVLANRVWHYHFGRGLVATPSDFGFMGGQPTHPELLDFLASKLQEFNWRLKPLHRLIMSSETYRQASDNNEAAAHVDSEARLLWRFPPRRLSAEEIRDTILLVCGKIKKYDGASLVPDGGPGFRLYRFMQDNVCTYAPLDTHGPETYRRAVYHQNARASVVDLMTDFDQPDCAFSTPRRAETTTPLQSLTMMNHAFTSDMSEALAARVTSGEPDGVVSTPIQRAFLFCFNRNATDAELSECNAFVQEHGLVALCRVLLNTSELIYVR